ncbi:MAG TPA: hypothetical protein VF629_05930 [Hymenobacter sp.]|jgi:hypothetical protein|uniref:hypothetical protein n=1 Tax=Hymenobacter sp. TaxID=1898978 RepID=UPI002EDB9905
MKPLLNMLLIAASLLAALSARAQEWMMALDMSTITDRSIPSTKNINRSAQSSPASPASFSYTPTPALKQQVVVNYVKHIKPQNPLLAKDILGADYNKGYGLLNKGTGLQENNAADVVASFMLLGYRIINDLWDPSGVINVSRSRAVRAQVAGVLAHHPKMTTPAGWAQVGEQFKLQNMLILDEWGKVGTVEKLFQSGRLIPYQKAVATLFKNRYGLDITQLKLTDQGFVKNER